MCIGWRGKLLKSKFAWYFARWRMRNANDHRRARLAKIKQGEAKALGKKGRALGRKF